MRKNEIKIIYGTDYYDMTTRLLKEAGLSDMIAAECSRKAGVRIGIKPNLVDAIPAELGATTHPEIVDALIAYLKAEGYSDIVILESSWVGGDTEESARVCGYYELAGKHGISFIDTSKGDTVSGTADGLEISYSKAAAEVDFLINVPVMKGHCQTCITCALKNLKGLLPDHMKRRFHQLGLHKPVAALNSLIHQDFILVDSICGDMSFEDGGNPHVMNRIFAAADPVLCDAYVCRLMEYDTSEVEYIGLAEHLGVGSADLSSAVITELNETVCDMKLPDIRRIAELKDYCEEIDSCSACYGYLLPALELLRKEDLIRDFDKKICIGMGYRGKTGKEGDIGIGSCTCGFKTHLPGCPPTENQMYEFLKTIITDSDRYPD